MLSMNQDIGSVRNKFRMRRTWYNESIIGEIIWGRVFRLTKILTRPEILIGTQMEIL